MTSTLEIRSSLKELLPEESPSVIALNEAIEKIGGVGNLIVAIESPNVTANKRFSDDFSTAAKKLPKKYFRYIEHRTTQVETFFKKHALLYLSPKKLRDLKSRIEKKLEYEKSKNVPLYFSLDAEEPEDFNLEEYKSSLEDEAPKPTFASVDSYFGGNEGKLLIVMMRSQGTNMSLPFAKEFISQVQVIIDKLIPESYDPAMKIGLSGTFPSSVEEHEIVKRDIGSTGLLCALLVAASIILFFRKIRPVFYLGATLLVSLSWVFCMTKIFIGSLNMQTAFLGAIVLGTGVNYGIILWGRYEEEGTLGSALPASLLPTLLAALTTGLAFGVLWNSEVRSLSQFGFIGSMGVLTCWVGTMTVLPLLIFIFDRSHSTESKQTTSLRWITAFSKFISQRQTFVVGTTFVMLLASAAAIYIQRDHLIEYDFSKLRNRQSERKGADYWDRKVGKLMSRSTVPTVAYLDNPDDALAFCHSVQDRVKKQPKDERRVGSCSTIFDLLPKNQDQKLSIIKEIGAILNAPWIKNLNKETQDRVKEAKDLIRTKPITATDLPPSLTQHFEDLEGNVGNIAFISPVRGKWLSDGRNLIAFAETLKGIPLPSGKTAQAAGDALIFSDIVQIIKSETPKLTLISFSAVFLIVLLLLRSLSSASLVITSLFVGPHSHDGHYCDHRFKGELLQFHGYSPYNWRSR